MVESDLKNKEMLYSGFGVCLIGVSINLIILIWTFYMIPFLFTRDANFLLLLPSLIGSILSLCGAIMGVKRKKWGFRICICSGFFLTLFGTIYFSLLLFYFGGIFILIGGVIGFRALQPSSSRFFRGWYVDKQTFVRIPLLILGVLNLLICLLAIYNPNSLLRFRYHANPVLLNFWTVLPLILIFFSIFSKNYHRNLFLLLIGILLLFAFSYFTIIPTSIAIIPP